MLSAFLQSLAGMEEFELSKSALKRRRQRQNREARSQAKLAQTLQAALFRPPLPPTLERGVGSRPLTGHPLGPQWRCQTCLCLNTIATRRACRLCGAPAPEKADSVKARGRVGGLQSTTEQRGRGRSQSPSFKEVLLNARKLGASPETVSLLQKDVARSKETSKSSGTKLNIAESKVKSTQATLVRVQERAALLQKQLDTVRAEVQTAEEKALEAKKDLEDLRTSLAQAPASGTSPTSKPSTLSEPHLLQAVLTLLDGLERLPLACTTAEFEPGIPKLGAPAVSALVSLRQQLLGDPPPAQLDEPLEEGPAQQDVTFADSDSDDGEPPSKTLRVEPSERQVTAAATVPGRFPASFADYTLDELERRLTACRDDLSTALECQRYTAANAISGVMAELTLELERRRAA